MDYVIKTADAQLWRENGNKAGKAKKGTIFTGGGNKTIKERVCKLILSGEYATNYIETKDIEAYIPDTPPPPPPPPSEPEKYRVDLGIRNTPDGDLVGYLGDNDEVFTVAVAGDWVMLERVGDRLTGWGRGSHLVPFEDTPPPPPPDTDVGILDGVMVYPGDELIYAVHDNLNPNWGFMARTLYSDKIQISMTNEMTVMRRLREDGRVDRYSKLSFWPEDLGSAWEEYFFSAMTPRQHELFNVSGKGWRDNKANNVLAFIAALFDRSKQNTPFMGVRPDGVAIYNFLVCGGTLMRKIGRWRDFTIIECQDTNRPPSGATYHNRPDLVFKQGLCGHNRQKISYYGIADKNLGDLYIPLAAPGGVAAVQTNETRQIPPLPLETSIDGVPVVVEQLCFRGSEILCLLDTGEWRYLLQQVSSNGNQGDFVLSIPAKDWVGVFPVPILGYRKE